MAKDLTPEELVLFRSGDETIFTRVYNAYEEEIYYFIYRKVKSAPDAHSLTAEVMFYLWRSHAHIESNGHINNYLYKAARDKSYSLLKKRRNQKNIPIDPPLLTGEADTDAPPEAHDILEAKDAARFWTEKVIPVINALPGINGKVAQLHYVEKKPIDEIAVLLDLQPKNVSGHLDYARQKLVEKFKTLGSSLLAYLFWLVANLF